MVIAARLAFAAAKKTCQWICRTHEQILSENILGHDGTLLNSEQLAVKKENDHRQAKHSRILWCMAATIQPAESEET